jgi:hypothetical protein
MPELSETEVLRSLALPRHWLTFQHEANHDPEVKIFDGTVSGGSGGIRIKLEIFESLKKQRFLNPVAGMKTPTSNRYTISPAGSKHLTTLA